MFKVLPDKPDPAFCKLSPPPEPQLYTHTPYACTLKTYDKFNNECKSGGLTLSHRLQVVKQGVHDQTTLVPSNHSCECKDNNDGTYSIHMEMKVLCAVKLFINMDKNLPAGGGELPSIHLPFLKNSDEEPKESVNSPPKVQAQPEGKERNERLK